MLILSTDLLQKVKEVTPTPESKPKSKATPKAETPVKPATPAKSVATKESPTKPASSPKKVKEPTVYAVVAKDKGAVVPIDVQHEGQSVQARLKKGGTYMHTLKLEAGAAFSVLKTVCRDVPASLAVIANTSQVTFPDGPYEGQQAIILLPAKPFPFLKLSEEIRQLIYSFYFAQKGVVGEAIVMDGRRTSNKDIYAKTFSEGSKERVALLAVNKEVMCFTESDISQLYVLIMIAQIHADATQVLYTHTLKFESTATVLDFLSQSEVTIRPLLKSIYIKNWVKASARNALHFLAEARSLTKLHIHQAVSAESDTAKAAKAFHADAGKFLQAVGGKAKAVDVLSFGKGAFIYKDEKKVAKQWDSDKFEEFKEDLKSRLK